MYASEYEYMPYNRDDHATFVIPFIILIQNVHVEISNRSAKLTTLGGKQAEAVIPYIFPILQLL